ncbi:MAG: efflux RND transporter periplasmic adaptor subunit [Chitinophagaceae bacterium]|nr:efflux RND transporter periplasmic adaptor subunit [Chitinophagaceae bacterium]
MNKKWMYRIVGILIGLVLLYFILNKLGIISKNEAIDVAVEPSKKSSIIELVSASGKIYPVSEVKISPDVSGEIISLNVEEGDSVKKGQVLGTINAMIYKTAVNKAQAQLNQTKSSVSNASALKNQALAQLQQAENSYNRSLSLFQEKVISVSELETAESAYKVALASFKASMETIKGSRYNVTGAQADVSEAKQSLQRTTLYAPMNGIVSNLFVKKGERVVGTAQMAGTEIMRVADMSKMKVDVEVGETEITKVSIGDTANIEVEAYDGKIFKGIVSKISQTNPNSNLQNAATSMNEQVTNYTVSVEIINESYAFLLKENPNRFPFRPGMSASVDIITSKKDDILVVPIDAVTTREDENAKGTYKERIKEYVFIDSNGFAKLQQIETGLQDNENIEIISGLKLNQNVIVAPYAAVARNLNPKDKIKIVKKEELYEKKEVEEESQ